jgi:YVTN family beta-propeller protein
MGGTGSMPKGVSISPDGTRLYVTNYGQRGRRNVTIFDANDLHRIGEIDVPGIVVESAVSSDGHTLYLSNFTRSSVQFVDLATNTVTHEVPTTGRNPKIVVLSDDGSRVFAANWSSRNVTEIDTASATVVRTLHAGLNPRGMAVLHDGTIYIANFFGSTMDIYDGPDRGHRRHWDRVCRIPRHLALAPDQSLLYVSCLGQDEVIAMDPASGRIRHRAHVGFAPKAIDVSGDGHWIFAANYGDHSVTMIDTTDWRTRTLTIPVMDHASGIVAARTGARFFVTGWWDDHLYAIDPLGGDPPVRFEQAMIDATLRSRAYHRLNPE